MQRALRVLVACEESGRVTAELRKLGVVAFSCDLLPTSGKHPEWHVQGDVTGLLKYTWDMIIAFPPCTYMSKAGARWMYKDHILQQDRLAKARKAKAFFELLYNANCEHIAIENPTPLKIVGLPKSTQVIQPYNFGDPYSKRTNLWLKGLPELKHTKEVKDYVSFLPSNCTGWKKGQKTQKGVAHTAKKASKTFPGIAKAMAEQWVEYLNNIKEDTHNA